VSGCRALGGSSGVAGVAGPAGGAAGELRRRRPGTTPAGAGVPGIDGAMWWRFGAGSKQRGLGKGKERPGGAGLEREAHSAAARHWTMATTLLYCTQDSACARGETGRGRAVLGEAAGSLARALARCATCMRPGRAATSLAPACGRSGPQPGCDGLLGATHAPA
jgi:hypothetical protein